VDIEFQIHASERSIVAHIMGQAKAEVTRGRGVVVAHGAQLTYMGRELPYSSVTGSSDTVYFFALRVPDGVAVDVASDLLWDLLTSRDPEGLITAISIETKTERRPVDPHNPEDKRAVEAALRALQDAPIPQALWLGE